MTDALPTPPVRPTPPPVRAAAEEHLRALVGRDDAELREDQWTRDRGAGRSTDAGRWWCSAPAGASPRSTSSRPRCCAPRGAGPTVIVSPLLALMRNQIDAAERAGIRAVTINSGNVEQWEQVHAAIAAGEVDVLLVSARSG